MLVNAPWWLTDGTMATMTAAPDTLTITRPDDWHLHVRD
ncbi:MAG: hypothetical protein ACD_23C01298G0002, partial [uncultured bacterium]